MIGGIVRFSGYSRWLNRKVLQHQLTPHLAPTDAATPSNHADEFVAAVRLVAASIGQAVAMPASKAVHGHQPHLRQLKFRCILGGSSTSVKATSDGPHPITYQPLNHSTPVHVPLACTCSLA